MVRQILPMIFAQTLKRLVLYFKMPSFDLFSIVWEATVLGICGLSDL